MSKPQVVIVRKDKRVRHKFLHALAFGLTGGLSGAVTAAEVANHAGYNARTRRLQEAANPAPKRREQLPKLSKTDAAEWRAEHVPSSREYRERHPS